MTRISATPSNEQSIHAALELSKKRWLLAIQVPGRNKPNLHPIKGGDGEGLMAKLDAARERVAKATGRTPKVTLCYERRLLAGAVPRATGHRVPGHGAGQPTGQSPGAAGERIDVESILHTLISWCRGEHHVCSMVVMPSVEEEDLRRCHRER